MFWQTFRSIKIGAGFIALLLLLPLLVQAQQPIVYGVFFYSPTCPHCHEVIDNHWPGIQEEFGDQLQVLFMDVSTVQGSQIMGEAITAMNIPSNGVPMLIIGTDVLIGSIDIPQRAPGIIRTGLNAGGIGYPPIPDINLVFEYMDPHDSQTSPFNSAAEVFNDPANLLALVVLVGLVGNLGIVGTTVWHGMRRKKQVRHRHRVPEYPTRSIMVIGVVVGMILAGSLLIGSFDDRLTLLLSAVVLAIFLVLAFNLFAKSRSQIASWTIPLVILAGLLVAGYLAYVETTLTEATCGAVGDCNTVQQSSYAHILGVPIGVIGIIGYMAMLLMWMLERYGNRQDAGWLLFGMAVIGVGFSIYLTFLEPFVIGASCVWCLTSAVIMTILLWLSLPSEQLLATIRER